jgi:hypothetical protein
VYRYNISLNGGLPRTGNAMQEVTRLFMDDNRCVAVKVMPSGGTEHRILERLLGHAPWPKRSRRAGCVRLWETLRLVPLLHDGIVRICSWEDVDALVMHKFVAVSELPHYTVDTRNRRAAGRGARVAHADGCASAITAAAHSPAAHATGTHAAVQGQRSSIVHTRSG